MSKTVDERIVEMRFDNAQFEKNVQTSMSTLDKLKKSLKLSDASKGLDGIGKAAKTVSFDKMEKSLSVLEKRFTLLGTIKNKVFDRFADSAVNSMQKLISTINSFTIGGIKTGGYNRAANLEKAQFQLTGLLKDGAAVEAVMDNVKTSVDGTAYSLDAAAVVASQLAASGMRAGDGMLTSLKAVAGVAAMTGSNYEDIGRIFTQVAGQGRLMGNDLLQLSGRGMNAAATIADYLTKIGNGAKVTEADVRDMVSKGKIDFNTFAKAMDDAFGEHATKANETFTGAMSNVKAALARIGEVFYTPIIADNGPLVKLFNTLREKINLIKQAITPLVGTLSDIAIMFINAVTGIVEKLNIQKIIDWASKINDPIVDLTNRIKSIFDTLKDTIDDAVDPVVDAVDDIGGSLKDLDAIVDEVILGKWQNAPTRFEDLAAAGYNWCEVQNKVNERLGCSFRYTQDQIDAQDQLIKSQNQTASATDDAAESTNELTDAQKKRLKELVRMSDEQLRENNLTEDQIKALHDLTKMAEKLGMPVDDLIDKLEQINAKWLVLDGIKNIGTAIAKVFTAIGQAFSETFNAMKPETVFNVIAAFHKFTTELVLSDENADKLKRTFKGLFAAIDLVRMVLGGGLKIVFRVISALLGAFNLNILDVTAAVGDAIVNFRTWVKEHSVLKEAFSKLVEVLKIVVEGVRDCVEALLELEPVQNLIATVKEKFDGLYKTLSNFFGNISFNGFTNGLRNMFSNLSSWIRGLDDSDNIGRDIIRGIVNGVKEGADDIKDVVTDIVDKIKTTFCELLGIHSPSTWGIERGKNIVEGVCEGISGALGTVAEAIGKLVSKIVSAFDDTKLSVSNKFTTTIDSIKSVCSNFMTMVKNFDFKKLLAIIPVALVGVFAKKVYDLAVTFQNGINSVNAVIQGFAAVEKSFAGVLNSFSEDIKSKKFMRIAISLGILVAAVVALSFVDTDKLYGAVASIVILAGVLALLSFAISKLDSASVSFEKGKGLNIDGIKTALIQIGIVIALLAVSVKLMGSMDANAFKQGFIGLAGVVGALVTVLAAFGVLAHMDATANMDKVGGMMIRISVAMLLMVGVCKLAAKLKPEEMKKGAIFAAGFAVFVAAMAGCYRLAGGEVNKLGGMMIKMAIALGLMVGVCKLIGLLDYSEMAKGALFASGFIVFVGALKLISQMFPQAKMQKLSGMMIALTVTLGLMVGVCKLIGLLSYEQMAKGAVFVGGFILLIGLLVKLTTISNEQQMAKVAGTILAMSVALGAMAAVCIILSLLTTDMLIKGVLAVSAFGLIMATMVAAARGVTDIKGTVMMMAVSIGIMAAAVSVLSFIKPEKLANATIALSTLMGMFALIESQANGVSKAAVSLGIMAATIGLIGYVLSQLASLPSQGLTSAATGLGLVMISLSAALAIAGNFGTMSVSAAAGVAVMTLALYGMSKILATLVQMKGIENAIKVSVALSVLLIGLAGAMAILSRMSTTAIDTGGLIKFVAAMGVLTLALSALTPVLQTIGTMSWGSIAKGLITIGVALVELSVGLKAMNGTLAGSASLLVAATALTVFTPVLETLGSMSLGSIVKGLVALAGAFTVIGVAGAILTPLAIPIMLLSVAIAALGLAAMSVGAGIALFGKGLQAISEAGSDAAQQLVADIEIITVGILELIPKIAGALTKVVVSICQVIIDSAPKIGKAIVSVMASVLEAIVEQKAQLLDTLTTLLVGLLDGLTEKLPQLLDSLSNFIVTLINGLADHIPEFIEAGVNLLGEIVKGIADNIEPIVNDIVVPLVKVFGDAISQIITAIGPYIPDIVHGITDIADAVCDMVARIVEAIAPYLPNIEGIVSSVTEGITAICDAFTNLVNQIAPTIQNITLLVKQLGDSITQILYGIRDIIQQVGDSISGVLDSVGGVFSDFGDGVKDALDGVADVVSAFGKNIKAGFDGASEVVDSFGDSARKILDGIADVIDSIGEAALDAGEGFSKLADGVATITNLPIIDAFNSMMVSIVTTISGKTALFSAAAIQMMVGFRMGVISGIAPIQPMFASAVSSLVVSVMSMQGSFAAAGTQLMVGFRTGITIGIAIVLAAFTQLLLRARTTVLAQGSQFTSAGRQLVIKLANGIKGSGSAITSAISSAMSSCSRAIRNHYSSFQSAGRYLGDGLVAGINAKQSAAYSAGYALGKKAVEGEKAGQQSNSPSKLTIKAGRWLGEGLIIGMNDMGTAVYKTGKSIGGTAVDSITGALDGINNLSDTDMSFVPSIRPVVDMDDLQNGSRSLSIGADLSASLLSKPVNSLQQIVSNAQADINASNERVINAINDLRNDLNKLYSDDDTEIALYVDSKKMASTLAKPLNRQLLVLQKRGAY